MGCIKLAYYPYTCVEHSRNAELKTVCVNKELTCKKSSKTLRSTYLLGFNGQEKDDELKRDGNSLDFGARIYDSRLGRFLSLDPLIKDYPMITPYCFAANNPIRLVDVEGKGPGDTFETEEAAAIDFGMNYNDNSIASGQEFVSVIYSYTDDYGNKYFSYSIPLVGGNESVSEPILKATSKNEVLTATIHSHGNYSWIANRSKYKGEVDENNTFSDVPDRKNPGDIQTSNSTCTKIYVVTPNGSLLVYDPNTENPEIKSIDTGGRIPSDNNDPSQIPGAFCDSEDNCKKDFDKWHKDEPYYKSRKDMKNDKESRNKDVKSHNVPSYE